MVLINDPNIDLEFLHFGKKYLDVSEEELEAYRLRCRIDKESRFVWFSEDVENSNAVANSKRIKDSRNVNDCEDVEDCLNVFDSKRLAHSTEVLSSEDVTDSNFVIVGTHVDASE